MERKFWGLVPKNLSRWCWSMAVFTAAGSGLFLGAMHSAHSDNAKYAALLSQYARAPGSVIVKVSRAGHAAIATQPLETLIGADRFRVAELKPFETDNSLYTVNLAGDEQTADFLEAAAKNPAIEYAEPNYKVRVLGGGEVLPNDENFGQLWGLKNTGQKDKDGNIGTPGADIGVTKAWATTTGSKKVIVAVIDTGTDYTHPDLQDNIFQNKADCFNDGVDHDGNGFVNDCHGWNFAGVSTNDPMDDNQHGTHTSGTIGAKGNNGVGVAGVAWDVSILPVKFLTGDGTGNLDDAVKAIQYATKMHANIMSNSWGGGGYSQALFDAITAAQKAGILFVAAAGNDSDNADSQPHYPASYQIDNVISVAATTNKDTLADFSTFGKRTVHIAAPGNNILSTVPKGGYAVLSGTSMATPHVSGAAALLMSANPNFTYAEVKDRLLKSRDWVPSLARKVASGGRLNIYNALNGIYPASPEPPESAWVDYAYQGQLPETAHPYPASDDQSWNIVGPDNAKFIRVVFSKVEIESGYDFLRVQDGAGNEVDSISGAEENSTSYFAAGNKLSLHFTSDKSVNMWGFAVAKVQVVY
jgi:thermitase